MEPECDRVRFSNLYGNESLISYLTRVHEAMRIFAIKQNNVTDDSAITLSPALKLIIRELADETHKRISRRNEEKGVVKKIRNL